MIRKFYFRYFYNFFDFCISRSVKYISEEYISEISEIVPTLKKELLLSIKFLPKIL